MQSATVEADLSVRSSGHLGAAVDGTLERAPGGAFPPLCVRLALGNHSWCRANTSGCAEAAPAPPPPAPPPPLGLRPYPWLTGNASAPALPGSGLSADPLVNHSWPAGTNG